MIFGVSDKNIRFIQDFACFQHYELVIEENADAVFEWEWTAPDRKCGYLLHRAPPAQLGKALLLELIPTH
jgi:hypothetical protein